jgi:hypothetical protein
MVPTSPARARRRRLRDNCPFLPSNPGAKILGEELCELFRKRDVVSEYCSPAMHSTADDDRRICHLQAG